MIGGQCASLVIIDSPLLPTSRVMYMATIRPYHTPGRMEHLRELDHHSDALSQDVDYVSVRSRRCGLRGGAKVTLGQACDLML